MPEGPESPVTGWLQRPTLLLLALFVCMKDGTLIRYFAEVADFYCRENNDEKEMMKLVYQSLRALCAPALPNELVRSIFELKAIVVNGEYPGVPEERKLEESTRYALNYIAESSVEKLYTFTVSDKVLAELSQIASEYRKRFMDRSFKSLEILKTLC